MPDILTVDEEHGLIEVQSYGVVTKDDIADSIEKTKQTKKK